MIIRWFELGPTHYIVEDTGYRLEEMRPGAIIRLMNREIVLTFTPPPIPRPEVMW